MKTTWTLGMPLIKHTQFSYKGSVRTGVTLSQSGGPPLIHRSSALRGTRFAGKPLRPTSFGVMNRAKAGHPPTRDYGRRAWPHCRGRILRRHEGSSSGCW